MLISMAVDFRHANVATRERFHLTDARIARLEAGIWFAPYLTWVTIAIYLNWTVVRLNGPFRGR